MEVTHKLNEREEVLDVVSWCVLIHSAESCPSFQLSSPSLSLYANSSTNSEFVFYFSLSFSPVCNITFHDDNDDYNFDMIATNHA